MDLNDLRSGITLVSLLIFAGIVGWAWWPRRRAEHEAAAQLPFADEEQLQRAAAPGRPKQGPTLPEGRSTYTASGVHS